MRISEKLLDLLFRQVSPERVLNVLKECTTGREKSFFKEKIQYDSENEKLFMDFAESTFGGYSENEQKLLCEQVDQEKASWEKHAVLPGGFLDCLIRYGRENLVVVGGEPRCKSEKVLLWRELFLCLGQDMVVCPYLAYEDYLSCSQRMDFVWPAILRTDDHGLYRMLENGMAENHNHLGGSTQSFQITWCRAMNYPQNIRKELRSFEGSKLQMRMSRGKQDNCLDLYEQLELAALVRSILFRAMNREKYVNLSCQKKNVFSLFDGEKAFREEYLDVFSVSNQLENITECLREGNGVILEFPDGESFCLDYMLDKSLLQRCADSHIRLLAGERYFLYQCTLECLKGDGFTEFEQCLFYLYLILKTNFRSEMIQTNSQTGFLNFQKYQNRKSDAWDNNCYFWEAVRMALNYRLDNEPIISIEGRLIPKAIKEKNIEKVYVYDKGKLFADCPAGKPLNPLEYNFDKELDMDRFKDFPFFYVYHFAKTSDKRKLNKNQFFEIPYRHKKYRENLRKDAVGLAGALRKSSYLRSRVRGIDSCSNEIGCRPEIFASAYRYLADVERKWNVRLDKIISSSPIRLSKTFHVGEDFLDIADGLRATDEAITFLQLERGSRIGHGLALGVNPEEHYRLKHYEIVTTKQNRLDDLIWLIYRSKELGINIGQPLESQLKSEADELFRYLYGKLINKKKWSCGLMDYYLSMKLRGDDPSLYSDDQQFEKNRGVEEFDNYLEDKNPVLVKYRDNEVIWGLNKAYHFDADAGIYGEERITCPISLEYVKFMEKMQNGMQKELYKRGIIIECNPSSNVLIGTFKSYMSHPIFRFNNRKLVNMNSLKPNQMHVCVNTDDLGVFDTSLEFEYALLKQALLSQEDDNSNSIHGARDVMEYLDDLRNMGIEATFSS